MSNQPSFFAIRCPAVNYGQTSMAWNAAQVIGVPVDRDQLVEGDQLFFNQDKKLWVTEKRSVNINVIPGTGNNNAFVRYDPFTEQMFYKSMHYGSIGSTDIQTIASTTDPNTPIITRLTYNFSHHAVGVGYSNNQLTFSQKGIYKIGASLLFRQTSGSNGHVYFAFHKNNVLIPLTATDTIVHGKDASAPVYVEIIEEILNPSDTISIACYTTDTHTIQCYATPAPNALIGISPSIIVTIQQIA